MNSPQKVQGGWVTAPETDFDPYANSSLDDPYPHFAKLRDLGPVFFLSRYSAYGVARHAEVEAVLRDPETFSSGAGVGLSNLQTQTETQWRDPGVILEVDPPLHARVRKVESPRVSWRPVGLSQAATMED